MITEIYLERDGSQFTIDARGHAPTRPLCAAVSCLLYTVCGWLHNAAVMIITERLDPGNARLVWRAKSEAEASCEAVFELAEIGFLQLQAAEPDKITVDVSE